MLVEGGLAFLGDVHDVHIISINVNSLIADNQLLVLVLVVTEYRNIGVTDIKLIFILSQEFELINFALMHLDQEEAQFFIEFICQKVKHFVFLIVDNLFDATDVELVIEINFLSVGHVNVDSILC